MIVWLPWVLPGPTWPAEVRVAHAQVAPSQTSARVHSNYQVAAEPGSPPAECGSMRPAANMQLSGLGSDRFMLRTGSPPPGNTLQRGQAAAACARVSPNPLRRRPQHAMSARVGCPRSSSSDSSAAGGRLQARLQDLQQRSGGAGRGEPDGSIQGDSSIAARGNLTSGSLLRRLPSIEHLQTREDPDSGAAQSSGRRQSPGPMEQAQQARGSSSDSSSAQARRARASPAARHERPVPLAEAGPKASQRDASSYSTDQASVRCGQRAQTALPGGCSCDSRGKRAPTRRRAPCRLRPDPYGDENAAPAAQRPDKPSMQEAGSSAGALGGAGPAFSSIQPAQGAQSPPGWHAGAGCAGSPGAGRLSQQAVSSKAAPARESAAAVGEQAARPVLLRGSGGEGRQLLPRTASGGDRCCLDACAACAKGLTWLGGCWYSTGMAPATEHCSLCGRQLRGCLLCRWCLSTPAAASAKQQRLQSAAAKGLAGQHRGSAAGWQRSHNSHLHSPPESAAGGSRAASLQPGLWPDRCSGGCNPTRAAWDVPCWQQAIPRGRLRGHAALEARCWASG